MTVLTQATAGVSVVEMIPNVGFKQILVRTPVTFVGGTDSITVDLSAYGCTNIIGVSAFLETTTGSVTICPAVHAATGGGTGFTTAVASSVLTLTPLLPATTCKWNFIIYAY